MVHLLMIAVMIWCKNQQILKILLLLILKKTACRIYFQHISKHRAKKIMNQFDLIDKTGNIYCNDLNNHNHDHNHKKNK